MSHTFTEGDSGKSVLITFSIMTLFYSSSFYSSIVIIFPLYSVLVKAIPYSQSLSSSEPFLILPYLFLRWQARVGILLKIELLSLHVRTMHNRMDLIPRYF